MISSPEALWDKFNSWLERDAVDCARHGDCRKWLRYYLDFCHKYGHGYVEEGSLGLFARKLETKGQDAQQIDDASKAVRIYYPCPPFIRPTSKLRSNEDGVNHETHPGI